MEWYHWYLCHPGETHTENTIRKKTFQKYGHLPEKVAEADPWDVLCIDLIGPYTIKCKNKTKKPLALWALTMVRDA